MSPPLDLRRLALDRPASRESTTKPPRKPWVTRFLLPAGILMGFVALLGAAVGRRLMPARSVTVVPVIVKRAEAQSAGTSLFQSPGWIEPRPTAISVAALAPGVIEDLLVVEGQHVAKGDPIARLISIDAELMVEHAKHSLAIREGELKRAEAEFAAARVRYDNPVHLQVQLADAESMLAKAQTELAKLPFLIEAAEADFEYTFGSLQGKQAAKGAIAGRIIARAESDHAASQATLEELKQRKPNLQREVDALIDKTNALKRQLDLLIEETRQLEEADAKVHSAEALRDEARLQLRQAELALHRNVVRAPIHGQVLRLVAAPGVRVMGLESTAGQSSSTVIEMYDPQRLQVRADVRLEDVPMVMPGQPVEIETASSAVVIRGRVLQSTSSANIQKNTLEVKVELIDPPATVRPEMLVTATFLAPAVKPSQNPTEQTERMFVPQHLVQTGPSGAFVWVVNADDLAQKRPLVLGGSSDDGLVEVKSGLNVTDKLISSGLDTLDPGGRVQVTGDDPALGMN